MELVPKNGKRSVEAWLGTAHFPCLKFGKSAAPVSTSETKQTGFEYAVPDDSPLERYRIVYT